MANLTGYPFNHGSYIKHAFTNVSLYVNIYYPPMVKEVLSVDHMWEERKVEYSSYKLVKNKTFNWSTNAKHSKAINVEFEGSRFTNGINGRI